MATLKQLLVEITWNEYNKAVRGDQFKPLSDDERVSIRKQINDPNVDNQTKEELKRQIIGEKEKKQTLFRRGASSVKKMLLVRFIFVFKTCLSR